MGIGLVAVILMAARERLVRMLEDCNVCGNVCGSEDE